MEQKRKRTSTRSARSCTSSEQTSFDVSSAGHGEAGATDAVYLNVARSGPCSLDWLQEFQASLASDSNQDRSAAKVLRLSRKEWDVHSESLPLDPPLVDRLSSLHIYLDQSGSGRSKHTHRSPALQRLTRDAAKGKFKRLRVSTIPSLGSDLKEVLATVRELVRCGIMIIPMTEDDEVVGPEMAKPLGEVLNWSRELDREKRSAKIKSGQRRVRAGGKRVGRPKRIFDRQEVVRLRDEEQLSWSQISQELGIGVGTARRAYHELKASPRPAKTSGRWRDAEASKQAT